MDVATQSQLNMFKTFVTKVYGLMALGVAFTGAVAYFMIVTGLAESLLQTLSGGIAFVLVIVAQLALVFGIRIAAALFRDSYVMSGGLYAFYAAMEGIILSPVLVYAPTSAVVGAFAAAAGLFAAMCVFGYLTKIDITRFGGILLVATLFLIVATIVGVFVHATMFQLIVSGIAVLIFAGWTAYDVQVIRGRFFEEGESVGLAVGGALNFYLDFLGMFINLLQIFSRN